MAEAPLQIDNPDTESPETTGSNPKWTGFYKFVKAQPDALKVSDNQDLSGGNLYGNYSWYQRLVHGSSTRLTRYKEYDLMDNDIEVSIALDIIAEEMTGNNSKTDDPIDIVLQTEEDMKVNQSTVMTLRAAMRHWVSIHDFQNRIFKVARNTIKYGDCFFKRKHDFRKWEYIHPKNVTAAIVDKDDITKILGFQVRIGDKKPKAAIGGTVMGEQYDTEIVDADHFVRFTLNDDMSDSAPFGESVLKPIYRAHKQKELLEDSIIIYRVQRAPERRVFYIDVGKMPPQRVKQYLEQIKHEIRQKKIPSVQGGRQTIDSVYNPQSMSEDFFFATRPDGRGSRVETLPGGAGLGELSDLEYFKDKVIRGLRVPASYMKQGSEGAIFSDGKVGTAYIQELRFAMYVVRLQGMLENILDYEFKRYLRLANIHIDETLYKIRLPAPTNFGMYRQQEVDGALLTQYGSADGITYLAKRFIMSRYLQLTPEDIVMNEQLLREEKGIEGESQDDLPKLYNPEGVEEGLGGGADLGLGGEPGGMEAGTEPAGPAEGGGVGEMGGPGGGPGGVV